MNKGICTHERPPRSKLGVNINDGKNYTWEKDFFCEICNWFVGYYSKIIMRNTDHLGGSP